MAAHRRVLVGRDEERAAIHALLARVAAGSGAVLTVSGEPGIGKTRLLEEAEARASELGFEVAWGRAWELGGGPLYWPWIEALRRLLPRRDEGRPAALAELLLARDRGGAIDALALHDALVDFLAGASARAPVLVLLDDLHAADLASVQLAVQLARSLPALRVAIVASHRDVEARLDPRIEAMLARLARAGDALVLGRLDVAAVAELLREETGVDDPEAARMMHDTTDGNPLFVRELLRVLRARQPAGGVPAGVRSVIRERLAPLSPATVALLQAAAVVGRDFVQAVVAEVAGVTAGAIDEAVGEARAADILADGSAGRLRFSHALVAETLAAELAPSVRARLHRRVAEALERRHAGDPAAPLDEIAHHWLAGGDACAARAVDAAETAASAAEARMAFADAAGLHEKALAALAVAAPADARRRATLMAARVAALARSGDRAAAEPTCAEAAELARALGDGELFARIALAFGAEGTVGLRDAKVIAMLGEALQRLPPGDGATRAEVMARLAGARQPEPDRRGPTILAREAIEMARRLAEPPLILRVIHAAMGALMDFAPASERAPLNALAAGLAVAQRDRPRALTSLMRLMFDRVALADPAGFEEALGQLEALVDEVGQARQRAVPLFFRSMRAAWQGRFAEAADLEREAFAIRARLAVEGPPYPSLRRVFTAVAREDGEAVARATDEVLAAFVGVSSQDHAMRALALALKGDSEPARASWVSREAAGGDRMADDPHLLFMAAHIAWQSRDAALAQAAYARLSRWAGEPYVVSGIAYVVAGSMDRGLLWLAALLGDAAAVERHARDGLAMCHRLGAPPMAASIRGDWAAILAKSDAGRERALILAREALDAAARMGMPALEQRCRATIAGLESRPAPTAEDEDEVALALEGELWTVSGCGETCRIRDSRGMRMLAELVANPNRELHVLDLSGAVEPVDGGDAGEIIDRRARDDYRVRLAELRAEHDEAASWNDAGRRARLEREIEDLTSELAGAFGLGGRARRGGAASERARSNVRRRIADALQRISEACPRLGALLNASIRTGTYCAYEPRAKTS